MSYDREKNPFQTLDEDDDDFGFSKPKYTSYTTSGGSNNPFAFADKDDGGGSSSAPMSKYERLQQQKENSMNNQLESTQRALASIYDSEAMGVATAEELVQQGEQLDNVDNKLDKINSDMKTSQKHLNSIKSVFGGIKSWWKGEKANSAEPEERKSATSSKLTSAMDRSFDSGAFSRSSQHPAYRLKSEDGRGFYEEDELDSKFLGGSSHAYDGPNSGFGAAAAPATSSAPRQQQTARSGLTPHDDKLDSNLDMMSEGMARLKGLAIGLGSEIERQNEQIETITGKADRADIKLTDQNRQMRQILR